MTDKNTRPATQPITGPSDQRSAQGFHNLRPNAGSTGSGANQGNTSSGTAGAQDGSQSSSQSGGADSSSSGKK